MTAHMTRDRLLHATALAFVLASAVASPGALRAQWITVHEQTYLRASHNWTFRRDYPVADRLFNAFDYGHSILYETLHARTGAPVTLLEEEIYDRLTQRILVRPPRLPVSEPAIAVRYAQLAPEALAMFHWAHVLHRQAYDILADERLGDAQKDVAMAELLRYYRSRPDLAFSVEPKSMDIMDGQHYSLAFRERYPKFNGLIWAYHWLQVGLYEPLLVGGSPTERQAMVKATVARFWQMLERPPAGMPYLMPMTAAVAPRFSERYPEFAIVFDNLHMMHDVISDVLTSERVPAAERRREILRAAAMFRDDSSYVTSRREWMAMATAMGVHNQGGPAIGFLSELPMPTVPRGMSMAGMSHDGDAHQGHGDRPVDVHDHEEHDPQDAAPAADPHAGHRAAGAEAMPAARTDSLAVIAVVDRFHAALAGGDSSVVLALLAPDARIQEGGRIESRDEYRGGHLAEDIVFASGVHISRESIDVRLDGNIAWVASTSVARGTFRGREVHERIAELMVLAREREGWRIRAISWSSRSAS